MRMAWRGRYVEVRRVPTPMMQTRIVRVFMPHRCVAVPMHMGLPAQVVRSVCLSVVGVIRVPMFVLDQIVLMPLVANGHIIAHACERLIYLSDNLAGDAQG